MRFREREWEWRWHDDGVFRKLNKMEVLDLRSSALAIFFLVMMLNLVLLGWSSAPSRPPVQRHPPDPDSEDETEAA